MIPLFERLSYFSLIRLSAKSVIQKKKLNCTGGLIASRMNFRDRKAKFRARKSTDKKEEQRKSFSLEYTGEVKPKTLWRERRLSFKIPHRTYSEPKSLIQTSFYLFTEIGQIFHNENIFNLKKTFQVEILLHIHRNMEIDLDKIIHRFARLHPRRLELTNILSEWLRNSGKETFPAGTCPGPP